MAEQGVYSIKNVVTEEVYVGGSVNIHSRWLAHQRALRKNEHLNVLLQAAWNKYGSSAFSLEVLETVAERSRLIECEQHYIDTLRPAYNFRKTAITIPIRTYWVDPFDPVRFWDKVDRLGEECWFWKGSRNRLGYGRIKILGKSYTAHRLAYAITYGAIRPDQCICHKCDNPIRVNPNHLFLGTVGDNNRDRHSKGRSASGNRNGSRTHPERRTRGEQH